MAKLDGMRRYGDNQNSPPGSSTKRYGDTPKTPATSRFANYSPKCPSAMATIEQLLQGSGGGRESYSRRPSPSTASKSSTPVTQRQCEAHSPVPRKSSSVLARVKEKAKKWRRTLSNKKKPALAASPAPSPGVSFRYDDNHEDEDQEEDPEYLGAPMYESELAPEVYKEAARQHPRAVHVAVSEKHVSDKHHKTNEAAGETLATQGVTFKTQDVHVPAPVSVKEYLMHKLEPGEDEKALSQIISDAISPRTSAGNVGVVEKMKEAVNSLLRSDQLSASEIPAPASTNAHEGKFKSYLECFS